MHRHLGTRLFRRVLHIGPVHDLFFFFGTRRYKVSVMIRDVLRESDRIFQSIQEQNTFGSQWSQRSRFFRHARRNNNQWDMPVPLVTRHQKTKLSKCRRKRQSGGVQNNHIQTGGANTMIIVDGADAVGSFVTRSTVPWNIAVPPDGPRLTYKFLQMSASYSMLKWREMSWIPLASNIENWKKRASAQVLSL